MTSPRLTPQNETPVGQQFGVLCAGIWVLAIVVRLWHLWLLQDSPLSHVLMGDARRYHEWGAKIAGGDWLGSESFYQAPLYPYFIGSLYWLFGVEQTLVRIAQAVLGATSCLFLAYAGRRFFSPKTGLLAGLMFAVYPPAIFFDGILQKTSLGSFLTCAVLAVMARAAYRPRRWRVWGLLGIVLGALILTRENALLLIGLLPVWLLRGWGKNGFLRRCAWLAFVALGLAVVLSPVALRNRVVGGEWHLTTSQFGPNFYIGNSEFANGRYIPLRQDRGGPEFERDDATDIAEIDTGRSLSPGEVSKYWTSAALKDIRADWSSWWRLMARKWFLIWNATEIIDTEGIYSHADASWILRGLLKIWHLGVLAPLAVLGVFLACRSWRRHGILLLFLVSYAASVSLFYVFARYRFPLVPALVPLAAAGLLRLPGALRRRQWVRLGFGIVSAIGMAWWTNLLGEPRDPMRSNTHYMIAVNWEQDGGEPAEIRRHLELAEEFDPDYAEVLRARGNFEWDQGRRDVALEYFERCVEVDDGFTAGHYDYGRALIQLGRFAEAIEPLAAVDRWEPGFAEGWAQYLLGLAYLNEGQFEGAVYHFQAAKSFGRDEAILHRNLGRALMKRTLFAEATEAFHRSLEIEPDVAGAEALLGDCYQQIGDVPRALYWWRRAFGKIPANTPESHRLKHKIRVLSSPNRVPQRPPSAAR